MFNQTSSTPVAATPRFVGQATSAAVALALTAGFVPAFRHDVTGETRLCILPNGRLACIHSLDSLPETWVAERDDAGRPMALTAAVRAGYMRGHEFWTLADLIHPRLDS